MVTLRTGLPEFQIDDIEPHIVLLRDVPRDVGDEVLYNSRKLKNAIRRKEVRVVREAKPRDPRFSGNVATKDDILSLHNLFVERTEELVGVSSAHPEVLNLLRDIQTRLMRLETRVDQLRVAPVAGTVTGVASRKDDGPTFIPSQIRSGGVTKAHIDVASTESEDGLEDAEEALRKLKG